MTAELLNNRYSVEKKLGQSDFSSTFKALDRVTGKEVVIKSISIKSAKNWKVIELFERESAILSVLKHDRIPEYIESFTIDTEEDKEYFLVQSYIPGESLAQKISSGERFSEKRIFRIAFELFSILEYLHGLNPPVIHRDIKPGNIIIDELGRVNLIDFGAVRDTLVRNESGGSTLIGTFGYIPPEQFYGKAVPSSDIYSAGVTLITLLSHHEPGELDTEGLKLQYHQVVNISEGLQHMIDKMIEPQLHDRYSSAIQVKEELTRTLEYNIFSSMKSTVTFFQAIPKSWGIGILVLILCYIIYLADTELKLNFLFDSGIPSIKPVNSVFNVNIYREFRFSRKSGSVDFIPDGKARLAGLFESLEAEQKVPMKPHDLKYGYLCMGDTDDRIYFAVEPLSKTQFNLYLDANNNDDLTDDRPFYHVDINTPVHVMVMVVIAQEKYKQPSHLVMEFTKHRENEDISIYNLHPYATANSVYLARLDMDGTKVEARAFESSNLDGLLKEDGLWLSFPSGMSKSLQRYFDQDTIQFSGRKYKLVLSYP